MEVASVGVPEVTESDEPQPAVVENLIDEPAEVPLLSLVLEVEKPEATEDRSEPRDAESDLEPTPEPVDVAITAGAADEEDETSLEIDQPIAEEPLAVCEDIADPAPNVEDDLAEVQECVEDSEEKDEEEAIGEVEDRAEEEGEDADLEQFLAGAKSFTRIDALDESVLQTSPRDSNISREKPVRWMHRAYRGDVDLMSAKSSRAVTLAVFGDGLLIVDLAGGAIGRFVPAMTGRRPARKVLTRAGSSAEAAGRLEGSRRLATVEIHSARIAKGRTWARELTIRTTQGEELQYRFASKRNRQVVTLLSAVLGPKLRNLCKAEKAPKRAG